MEERSLVKACERLESGDVSLRELQLYEVDARFAGALSRPSCLESLTLRRVELDRDLADALAKQMQLTKLELVDVRLGDGAASHLATALREMTRLEEVRLYMDEAVEDDVKLVLAAIGELPQLQMLGLSGRVFGGIMQTLAEAVVEQGRLRELMLFDATIGDDGVGHLAAMLERNCSLLALSLRWCEIGDAGLERLGRALIHNTTLRKLITYGNPFHAVGVSFFADIMGDMHGLQVLDLGSRWEVQLFPGIERNYSLLEVPGCPTAQPLLDRNARGYAKARAATLAWLCVCRFHPPKGITRDIGRIIARHIYLSRGWSCWADTDGGEGGEDDAK